MPQVSIIKGPWPVRWQNAVSSDTYAIEGCTVPVVQCTLTFATYRTSAGKNKQAKTLQWFVGTT